MDSDDEQEESRVSYQGLSGCIILINCYDPLSLNTASKSFEATCEMVRENMRRANSRVIGVCLYGIKETNSSGMAVQNMKQILPLGIPCLQEFQSLLSENINTYGQATDMKLSDVLWQCNKMFTQYRKLLAERTVIILTRLDTPPVQMDRRPTLKRVLDLTELDIALKLVNISKETYKVDPFYEQLLETINKGNEISIPNPVWKSDEIQSQMRQHTHRHLALARLSLQIGDMSIGVGVYKLVQPCAMPKKARMLKSTNEIVTSLNRTLKSIPTFEDNNEVEDVQQDTTKNVPLLKSETLFYQIIGNEKIEFTTNEIDKIKNPFEPRVMKLLGFKPNHILQKEKWFLKSCSFLFPNETIIEGSTIAFKALHQACIDTSMIALCVLCTRANSKPNIVALNPCVKPLGLDIDIGFDIIYIPFLENMKDIPDITIDDGEIQTPDQAHSIFMKDILDTLTFEYKSDTFENPRLQCLYRAIESLALNEESTKPFVDTTKPEQSRFQTVDSEVFYELFGPFGAIAKKRPASTENSIPKRATTSHHDNIDEELLTCRIERNHIDKYTVKELKDILKWINPPQLPALTGLKKGELVNLVYKYYT